VLLNNGRVNGFRDMIPLSHEARTVKKNKFFGHRTIRPVLCKENAFNAVQP